MAKRIEVRLVRPWNGRPAGHVITHMDCRTAELLFKNGTAERVKKTRKRKKKVIPDDQVSEPSTDDTPTGDDLGS